MTDKTYRRYRFRAGCPLEVVTDDGNTTARARNVNQYGMCIDGHILAEPGQDLTVMVNEEPTKGVVRWVQGQAIGIAFDTRITPRMVDLIRFTRDRVRRPGAPTADTWAF